MQEKLKKVTQDTAESTQRSVTLCFKSKAVTLYGDWKWEMSSDAIYCSDVMSFPADFEGTKGIIHPDDFQKIRAAMELLEDRENFRIDFRIITTYGEVKTICGYRVSREAGTESTVDLLPGKEQWQELLQQLALQKEADFLQLRKELIDLTERHHGIGCWLINKETAEAWYSDNLFRIYGLAPQSLNAHANTFYRFIHPDDRVTVLDAFEKAYAEDLPLHLEYRVVLADGVIRYLKVVTDWLFNAKGQRIFAGIVNDLSEEKALADELQTIQTYTALHQQVLHFSERQSATGYFYINLVTRKAVYSENYLRIYGFKQTPLSSYNSFMNLVHPEDREHIRDVVEKMFAEHILPEIQFRIIRPDGKTRYLRQSGKLFVKQGLELTMIGIVQDITAQIGLEKKLQDQHDVFEVYRVVREMSESHAGICSIAWLNDGYMQWSEGLYKWLGFKPGAIEPIARLLYKQIHIDDLKAFKEAEMTVLNHQRQEPITVRLISKHGIRPVKITFYVTGNPKEIVVGLLQDMSFSMNLHQQLFQNKALSDLVTASVHDMLILTNADHIVTLWNDKAVEKTGVSKEDALHEHLFDVLPHLNNEHFLSQLNAALRGNEIRTEHYVYNSYLKRSHHYQLWPLRDEDQKVIGVLHVVQDISKELELQKQLSERLNFIGSLVESSVDRIVVLDRFMNYLYWNRKAEEYYAIDKEKVLGKNILEVFPSFRNHPGYGEFRKVLKGETVYLPPSKTESNDYFETWLTPIKDETGDVTAVLWSVHDLSERRDAAKKLKEEHRRLKEAQAIGHVGSFEWIIASNSIYWSDEVYDIYGVGPDEKISLEKAFTFIHPEDQEDTATKILGCKNEPCRLSLTHRIIRPNGETRIVTQGLQSFADEYGKVTHITGTVQDVTFQKLAEQQIREQAHYLQRIQQAVPDMISITNLETKEFEYLNLEIFLAQGFDPEDMKAMTSQERLEIIHVDDRELLAAYFQNCGAARDEEVVTVEYRAKNNQGQWKWFLVRGRPFQRNESGVVTHVLNVIENITERKNSEEKIREGKEFLQSVMDSSLDVIQVFNAVRNDQGKIIDFVWRVNNKKGIEQNGDVIGKSVIRQNPGVIQTGIFDKMVQVTETSIPYQNEQYYTFEQFDDQWFDLTIVKHEDGVILTTRNITSQKKADQELFRLKDDLAKKATDKYMTLFNSIEQGFCTIEVLFDENNNAIDYRFLEINPSFEAQTGLKDAVGKTMRELAPDHEAHWFRIFGEVALTGTPRHFEENAAALGRWYSVYAMRIGAPGEHHVAILFNDISERKHKEIDRKTELKENKDMLAQTALASPDSIAIYDLVENTPFT